FLDHWLVEDDMAEYLRPWQYDRLNAVERILLAQRLPGEPAKTTRHLNDLLRLQPPNAARARMLFETAVLGRALGADDALGLNKLKTSGNVPLEMPAAGAKTPPVPSAGFGKPSTRDDIFAPVTSTPPTAKPDDAKKEPESEVLKDAKQRDGKGKDG